MLSLAAEKMFLEVTEPLDSLLSLKLLQIVRGLVDISYVMGHQDGSRSGSGSGPCHLCPYSQTP